MISIPHGLTESTLRREGEPGRTWLDRLPALIDRLLDQWSCEVVERVRHGGVAVVVPVRRGDEDAVLKVSYPHTSFDGETNALRLFRGRGTVRLLEADEQACALLLERAGPWTLASLPSTDEAIEVAGGLARRLAVPAPEEANALAQAADSWADQLEQQLAAAPELLPLATVEQARETIALLGGDTTPTMMHGDLHAENVLAAVREPWLTIDPVGWRGTAAFDAFTVVAGSRDDQARSADPQTIHARIRRYAAAANVDADLAAACCQARATSAYLYQRLAQGDWFDLEFLRTVSVLGLDR